MATAKNKKYVVIFEGTGGEAFILKGLKDSYVIEAPNAPAAIEQTESSETGSDGVQVGYDYITIDLATGKESKWTAKVGLVPNER